MQGKKTAEHSDTVQGLILGVDIKSVRSILELTTKPEKRKM